MIDSILNKIEELKLLRGTMGKEKYTPFDTTDPLDRFNQQISDQIDLALTISNSFKEDDNYGIEYHEYANEALQCIDGALTELETVIRELRSELLIVDHPDIHISRINDNLDISEQVLHKASHYLLDKGENAGALLSGIERKIMASRIYLNNLTSQ